MGRGGVIGGKGVIVGFLEAAVVDFTAEVRKFMGAVGEYRERQTEGRRWNLISEIEGGSSRCTSRAEQSTLMTGVGLPGKKDGLVSRRKVSTARKMEWALLGITKEPVVAKVGERPPRPPRPAGNWRRCQA
jgi:hypothetical protein